MHGFKWKILSWVISISRRYCFVPYCFCTAFRRNFRRVILKFIPSALSLCKAAPAIETKSLTIFYLLVSLLEPAGILCPAGSYCTGGSAVSISCHCSPGYFCDAGTTSSDCRKCPVGYYCSGVAEYMVPCTAAEGYFCPRYVLLCVESHILYDCSK